MSTSRLRASQASQPWAEPPASAWGYRRQEPQHGQSFATTAFQMPNLSLEEERDCLRQFQCSDDPKLRHEAQERIWLAFAKLVVSIASEYRRSAIEADDLIGVGFLGLYGAIAEFDLRRSDVRLATYAIPRIRHEIQTYLRKNTQPVALPDSNGHRQLIRNLAKLLREARRACERDEVQPELSELSKRIAVRVALSTIEIESTLQLLSGYHLFLDDTLRSDLNEAGLNIESHESSAITSLDSHRIRQQIHVLMDEVLGRSERRVFEARCMTDSEPMRLDDLAAELGVSPERVYQLEASAKKKIAVALAQQGLLQGDPMAVVAETRIRASRRPPTRHMAPVLKAAAAG